MMQNQEELEARIEKLKKRHGIDERIANKSGRTVYQVEEDFDRRVRKIFSALPDSYYEEVPKR